MKRISEIAAAFSNSRHNRRTRGGERHRDFQRRKIEPAAKSRMPNRRPNRSNGGLDFIVRRM
jgi:hypothetical protein